MKEEDKVTKEDAQRASEIALNAWCTGDLDWALDNCGTPQEYQEMMRVIDIYGSDIMDYVLGSQLERDVAECIKRYLDNMRAYKEQRHEKTLDR
jgi:hypothetical protein